MDPDIMKLPRYPNHLSRLRADAGIDELGAAPVPTPRRLWSIRPVLQRIRDLPDTASPRLGEHVWGHRAAQQPLVHRSATEQEMPDTARSNRAS